MPNGPASGAPTIPNASTYGVPPTENVRVPLPLSELLEVGDRSLGYGCGWTVENSDNGRAEPLMSRRRQHRRA